MWGQVSMNMALRAFLNGRTVKVVDFNAETVLSLAEVLERFSEGAVFFTETVAVNNLDFSEAVEEMTEDLPPAAPDPEESAEKERAKRRNNKTVEEVEHKYQTRKIDDLGKLRSLRNAGWSVAKIADEFRCAKGTVYNTLKRLEEQEAEA